MTGYNWAYGWGVMDLQDRMRIMSGFMTQRRDCSSSTDAQTAEKPYDPACYWGSESVRSFILESYEGEIPDGYFPGVDKQAVQESAGKFIKGRINRQLFNRLATGGLLWWLFRR